MLYLMILFMFLFFVGAGLMLLNFILSKKIFKKRDKLSSFECGFDNISLLRMPFSVQFYLIGIIFLIFDVEIALLFPVIYNLNLFFFFNNYIFIMILLILIYGTYYEWKEGSLSWLKD